MRTGSRGAGAARTAPESRSRSSFADYYKRFVYDRDFASAPEKRINEFGRKSTTRPNIWEVYPNAIVVEAHVPGSKPESEGMDWSSLLLVFEQHDSRWYLTALVHDQWTVYLPGGRTGGPRQSSSSTRSVDIPPASGGAGREDRPDQGRGISPPRHHDVLGRFRPLLEGSGEARWDRFAARVADRRTAGTQSSSARIAPTSTAESHPLGVIRKDRNETGRTQAP